MKLLDDGPVVRRRTASPTVAIALGGGGARGLAHIVALEALEELGIRPVADRGHVDRRHRRRDLRVGPGGAANPCSCQGDAAQSSAGHGQTHAGARRPLF